MSISNEEASPPRPRDWQRVDEQVQEVRQMLAGVQGLGKCDDKLLAIIDTYLSQMALQLSDKEFTCQSL